MPHCHEISSVMAATPFKGFLRFIQTRFLKTSPTPLSSSSPLQSSFTVQYLTNSCGIPLETALSISQKIRLNQTRSLEYDSVFGFLKSCGFSRTDTVQLITKYPKILESNPAVTLKPKFEYLVDCGFVGSVLPTLVLSHPSILRGSLESYIKPLIEILIKYLDTNEKVLQAFQRSPPIIPLSRMQKNIDFFLCESVPIESIGKLFFRKPGTIVANSDRVVFAVNAMKKIGMLPHVRMFPRTLEAILSMNESNFQRKLDFFKNLGWSEEDISNGMMQFPSFLEFSEEKVKRSLDFYVNTLKLDRRYLIGRPVLLGYSIHKRLLPRYNLLKYLESKELISPIKAFLNVVVRMSEERFVEHYVSKFEDQVPDLMKFYKSSISDASLKPLAAAISSYVEFFLWYTRPLLAMEYFRTLFYMKIHMEFYLSLIRLYIPISKMLLSSRELLTHY